MTNEEYVLERMARAGYQEMFEDKFDALSKDGIERALWLNIARMMMLEIRTAWEEAKELKGRGE